MEAIVKTVDPIVLSFAQSVLTDADIPSIVLDNHMSMMDGSVGVLPRRLMVGTDDLDQARLRLQEAGLGHELCE